MMPPPAQFEDEELSDDQIQQLLEEARARLERPTDNEQRFAARTQSTGRLIPRLQTVVPHALYIREKDGIATVDPKLLISEEQRKLAESLRTVDTMSVSKKRVRRRRPSLPTLHMRKTYPNTSLDADQLSVMDSPAPMRALFS
jgi:chromatin segregation and condensation protein Rec8/ScpA/Scc1 (kleisin family)